MSNTDEDSMPESISDDDDSKYSDFDGSKP